MSEHRPYVQWIDPAAAEALARLATDDTPDSWQDRALCAEADPEEFYPERGGSTRAAKKVCAVCPVRTECLEYALGHSDGDLRHGVYPVGKYGVWGGLSPEEREVLLSERRAA